MKKVFVGALAAMLVLTLGIVSVSAAGTGNRGSLAYAQAKGGNVCGFAGSRCGYNDADQDGVCDTCGLTIGHGARAHYSDGNGDGICDNYAAAPRSGSEYRHDRNHSDSFGSGAIGRGNGHHGGAHHE